MHWGTPASEEGGGEEKAEGRLDLLELQLLRARMEQHLTPSARGACHDQWKAKCKCKCGSDEHHDIPPYRCKKCACGGFQSDFLCV